MRTKALLLGAMIGVASLVSSQAQVYSVNIVGYINVTVLPGWNLLANQLDNGAGNYVKDLIVPPAGESISVFSYIAATQKYDATSWDAELGEWDKPLMQIPPGSGFFLASGSTWTLTFVGQVMTGPQTMPLVVGWQMVAPIVPQDGDITVPEAQGGMNYVPSSNGDSVFFFNAATQKYDACDWDGELGEWNKQPVTTVGQGFFLARGETGSWARNFSVSGN